MWTNLLLRSAHDLPMTCFTCPLLLNRIPPSPLYSWLYWSLTFQEIASKTFNRGVYEYFGVSAVYANSCLAQVTRSRVLSLGVCIYLKDKLLYRVNPCFLLLFLMAHITIILLLWWFGSGSSHNYLLWVSVGFNYGKAFF